MRKNTMIHALADIQTESIGEGTQIWQYAVVLQQAVIGKNCNINCHVFIENDVVIGNNATIKSGVQLWDGIRIGENVFIGPNATFTNDNNPRSKQYPDKFQEIKVNDNASIGAGAIILGGIRIGQYAMVGAGAVVTKNVPERALVIGNPARIVGWLNKDGTKMRKNRESGSYIDKEGNEWKMQNEVLVKV